MTPQYNTTSKKLIFPIYGRSIQNMVDHCVTIEDREERLRCAETIVRKMENFSPMNKDREDFYRVLWDHLFIMSGFALDVDFPYPIITKEEYEKKEEGHLEEPGSHTPKYRHYGRLVEEMIAFVRTLPEGEKRLELSKKIAVQMKKDYLNWNSKGVTNAKIFTELYELSGGEIYLDDHMFALPEASELTDAPAASPKTAKKGGYSRNKNRKK